jgi:hypothetical protein
MPVDVAKVSAFLGRMAVFKTLKPPQLEAIARNFEMVSLAENDVLLHQGEVGTAFYVVFSGRLQISRQEGENDSLHVLAHLVPGDYVGEESLLYGNPRTANVSAEMPSVVLRMDYDNFAALIQNHALVIPYFVATVESRRLSRQLQFDWLGAGESIYLLVRKHRSFLLYKLLLPVGVNLISWVFLFLAIVFSAGILQWIYGLLGLSIFLVSLAMGVWQYIDWGNDYYIVTNQRVIWLEKVIGLYDSREEAPLGTVVAVNIQSDQIGRILGYGDISIKTYTGAIVMRQVAEPNILVALIDELVGRGRQQVRQSEAEAIEKAIRSRLGLPAPSAAPPPAGVPTQTVPQMSAARKLLADFFKMRYEEGSKITFRKHWMVLLGETLWPNLLIFVATVLLIIRIFGFLAFISLPFMFGLWLAAVLVLSVWWVYGYVDWRNDMYQITDDTIIDIYRRPLGEETKKTAAIDNILSLQHTRDGILRLLLNYGDVIANVGSDKFVFMDVFDPPSVEHEIFHRISQRKRKAREAELVQQREYIADWLAAYHRQVAQLQSNQPK